MGVVYKLTPEISSFIITQKQNDPRISCQNIAGMVFLKFNREVSKSSVHELLKQAHVITPRAHKVKEKFKIPQEKKAEILKSLAPFVEQATEKVSEDAPMQPNRNQEAVVEAVSVVDKVVAEPLMIEHFEVFPGKGDIFLKAALWDLSFNPVLGLNNFEEMGSLNNNKLSIEWKYLTQAVHAIKIEPEDNNSFFVDSRFQSFYSEDSHQDSATAAIERAACEVADYVLNNVKPVIIREYNINYPLKACYDLIGAFENAPGKSIKKVSLVAGKNQILAEFNSPLEFRRQFIFGVSCRHKEFQWVMDEKKDDFVWQTPLKDRANKPITIRIVKKDDRIIVTNLQLIAYEELIQMYFDRHPSIYNLSRVEGDPQETILDQSQWLKRRLKERARMFFPADISQDTLEEILALSGNELSNQRQLEVFLSVPDAFEHIEKLRTGIESVNNLDIVDYSGRRILVRIYTNRR